MINGITSKDTSRFLEFIIKANVIQLQAMSRTIHKEIKKRERLLGTATLIDVGLTAEEELLYDNWLKN